MWGSQELLSLWFLVLAAGGSVHTYRPSRRVCAVGTAQGSISQSFVQRVYQPLLTTCDGYRACSTYRTIYRTAYRRGPGPGPARPRYACCPGWKRTSGLPGACAAAICQPPCGNGGSCVWPGHCHCPAGWQGDTCHTDVDECSSSRAGCPQGCVNTAGSYQCQCQEGHHVSADGTHCLPTAGPPRVALSPVTGVDPVARAEVQRLRARVEVLEQKLQLVLAPLHGLALRAPEHGPQDPGSLLAHSLQQLDRIDSLSEQISFLEEQLGSCEHPPLLSPSSEPWLLQAGEQGRAGSSRRPGDPASSSTPRFLQAAMMALSRAHGRTKPTATALPPFGQDPCHSWCGL